MLLAASAIGATGATGATTAGGTGVISLATKLAPMFTKLLSGEVFSKTIGQIKDGFDCWGSTWTPTRAKQELPEWMAELAEGLQLAVDVPEENVQESINAYFANGLWQKKLTSQQLEDWIGWRYDTARDCTLRGLKDLEKGIDAYILEMANVTVEQLKSVGYNASYFMKTVTLYRFDDRSKGYTKSVPQFKISKSLISTVTGTTPQTASMGIGAILLIAAIAFGMKKFK
jgi:hypothetical protein